MSDIGTEVNAAYLLVDYAWGVLKANYPTVWDESKYGGLIPIVPLSEEPELDEYDGPHIVYGYAEDPTGSLHARSGGSITFAVYDQNFRRLGKTMNILKAAFERQDETARDVNNFTSVYNPGGAATPPYLGIRFGYISVAFVEGGTPEETEGGRQSAIISITYEYYVDYDVITSI